MSDESTTPRPTAPRRRLTLRRRPAPPSALASRWTSVDGIKVHYRESPGPPDGATMTHLHGFGLSGAYLVPTAELLADDFH
ncbi:MAG TPA: alpha/beta hydrolase, partial [Microbacterium sp.]|nr:alpha/beta hydrolase [Microbacterium sp.]